VRIVVSLSRQIATEREGGGGGVTEEDMLAWFKADIVALLA